MNPRQVRCAIVALVAIAQALPAVIAGRQSAPATPPAIAPVAAEADFADLKASILRLQSTLDAVGDYEARLSALDQIRAKNGGCTPDAASQSISEALLWAVDAERRGEADLARGTSGVDSCRLSIAGDALDGMTEQSGQAAEMLKVFAGLPAADASLPALDQVLEQARWVAALKIDLADLTELARRVDAAKAIVADDASLFAATAARATRLVDIAHRADEMIRVSMSCAVSPQPLAAVRRIGSLVEPVMQQTRELESLIKAAKDNPTACGGNTVAAAPKPPAGPSWLPPPASEAAVKKGPAALPSWVPGRDTPAAQTATTRSADAVGEVRDRLIVEEAQRIEDQARRLGDARTQRVADAQRAQDTQTAQAAQAAQAAQVQHTQALAQAQQQVVQVQQQRAQRRTSFLGLLGRVTAAVGVVAATGGLGLPALGAILPALGAVGAVKGGGAGMLNATAALPMPAGVAQAAAVARAATGSVAQAAGPAGMPSAVPAATGSGATRTDPFIGGWDCTIASTEVDAGGKQTSRSDQTKMNISGGNGTYTLPTQYGALTGQAASGQVVFATSIPQGAGGACTVDIRLHSQRGDALAGSSNVTCPRGEQMRGTIQCRANAQ